MVKSDHVDLSAVSEWWFCVHCESSNMQNRAPRRTRMTIKSLKVDKIPNYDGFFDAFMISGPQKFEIRADSKRF